MWKFAKNIVATAFTDLDELLSEFYDSIIGQKAGAFGECPPGIDRRRFLIFAYLCHLAYVARVGGESVVREALLADATPIAEYRRLPVFFPGDDQYMGFSLCSENDLVFVFRGTAELRDWLENVCGALVGSEQIHAGFDRMAEQAWPWVAQVTNQRLLEPGSTIHRIVFTGHSLGGAMAVLLSHRMSQILGAIRGGVTIEACTFGCPKIGSEALHLTYPLMALRAIGDQFPEISLTAKGYQSHGDIYLLANRFRILRGISQAQIGLINWARMHFDVAERAAHLMRADSFSYSDQLVCRLLLQSFPNFCSPPNEMFKDVSPLLLPFSIKAFIRDEGRDMVAADDSKAYAFLSSTMIHAPVLRNIKDVLARRDEMIELSRTKLEANTFMKGLSLIVMTNRHSITHYIHELSLGAVRL
jgi:hypothetical protein